MDQTKTQTGKHDWVVFLCTGTALSATEILQRYVMQWAVEVYFKEAKQPLARIAERAKQPLRRLYHIHSFGSYPILPAGDRQTNTRY
ncbi:MULTISPECIES: hypothetical protein [Nitrosomonas]|uniref:Transposase IS4-like domain-containing protein n=1 Tax=Nitrosomonas communis TaxID=44574 RepID=A0A5D3YF25_9PROT|nr:MULTISPECIES: hypothetical protein [Nitrosomonas]TYP88183.1 hypothetical protein BCL69_102237 [Nitrosomonas communis]UVS59989.1 hypothetical protein NX761_10565 [Nitrosomonas sp. PLL12]